jgi:hydroxymethylglutaryl-CoA lyase
MDNYEPRRKQQKERKCALAEVKDHHPTPMFVATRRATTLAAVRTRSASTTVAAIHEVSPRDGLQNESVVLTVEEKMLLLQELAESKPSSIEVTSFVRADLVPQLADADEVCKHLRNSEWSEAARAEGIAFAGLVPNMRGYERFADR